MTSPRSLTFLAGMALWTLGEYLHAPLRHARAARAAASPAANTCATTPTATRSSRSGRSRGAASSRWACSSSGRSAAGRLGLGLDRRLRRSTTSCTGGPTAGAPRNAYARWLRKNHFHHHFHTPDAQPRRDHAACGTRCSAPTSEPTVVRVPRRMALVWLVDADGDAAARVRRRLRGRRPPAPRRRAAGRGPHPRVRQPRPHGLTTNPRRVVDESVHDSSRVRVGPYRDRHGTQGVRHRCGHDQVREAGLEGLGLPGHGPRGGHQGARRRRRAVRPRSSRRRSATATATPPPASAPSTSSG